MKKETLEEAAERLSNIIGSTGINDKHSFMLGVFWQQEQDKKMYSEEEVLEMLEDYDREFKLDTFAYTNPCSFTVKEWFETVKKK